MATKNINSFTEVTTVGDSDLLPIAYGTNKNFRKITIKNIFNSMCNSITNSNLVTTAKNIIGAINEISTTVTGTITPSGDWAIMDQITSVVQRNNVCTVTCEARLNSGTINNGYTLNEIGTLSGVSAPANFVETIANAGTSSDGGHLCVVKILSSGKIGIDVMSFNAESASDTVVRFCITYVTS